MDIWNFRRLTGADDSDENILKAIHQVFLDGFGLQEGWSLDGISKALKRSTVLGLLTTAGGEVNGYALYSIPDAPLSGAYMLWEDAICLKKGVQGSKKTREVFERAGKLFPDREFGWIGGRTQNPLVMKRYGKLGSLFPLETAYDGVEGRLIMQYLLEHIGEAKEATGLDRSSGICRGIYRERRLGDYQLGISGTEQFEERLSEWGFDREHGDALLVVAKLYQPIHFSADTPTAT